MTVIVQGYSTLTGNPRTILDVLQKARFIGYIPENHTAEDILRELANANLITIKEETA